jgi:16S rRNA G966 N2-methylase RsmD
LTADCIIMKIFQYLRYFFYIVFNWNFHIAWHILKQEIRGEKKYGIDTSGADELGQLEKKGIDTSHATIYMPASYDLLEAVFQRFSPGTFAHFLDIGCGKGRAMCVAAHYGAKKITGIDFSRDFCVAAEKNMAATRQQFPEMQYSIINNDAFYYDIPDDVDGIFLFNPFDEIILDGVVERILESHEATPRKLTIIYVNPLHKEVFTDAGFKEAYHFKKMKYLEVSVMELGDGR